MRDATWLTTLQRSHEAWLLGVILVMVALLGLIAPGFLTVGNFVALLET
jgi:ribose/xylose/arabinose/galactoside ABC-type transport system permease subunit